MSRIVDAVVRDSFGSVGGVRDAHGGCVSSLGDARVGRWWRVASVLLVGRWRVAVVGVFRDAALVDGADRSAIDNVLGAASIVLDHDNEHWPLCSIHLRRGAGPADFADDPPHEHEHSDGAGQRDEVPTRLAVAHDGEEASSKVTTLPTVTVARASSAWGEWWSAPPFEVS